MASVLQPGTPEWELLVLAVQEDEAEITESTNVAREAALRQGQRFCEVAPVGPTKARNGNYKLLQQLAKDAGIAFKTVEQRRSIAAQTRARAGVGTLLADASDVEISFETLRTILADNNPERLLTKLIKQARDAQATRISRDAVRRERGMVTGTVGTAEATAERMERDPAFRSAVWDHQVSMRTHTSPPRVPRADGTPVTPPPTRRGNLMMAYLLMQELVQEVEPGMYSAQAHRAVLDEMRQMIDYLVDVSEGRAQMSAEDALAQWTAGE